MKNNYVKIKMLPTLMKVRCLQTLLLFVGFVFSVATSFAQTCVDDIPPGNRTSHLTAAEVTWNISGDPNDITTDATLNSVTVVGQPNPFTDLLVPDAVGYQFTNPYYDGQYIRHNSVITVNVTQGPAIFDPALLAANTDRNMRHYLALDHQIFTGDYAGFF